MIFDVPFYKQTTELNCGPGNLRIAVAYLDKDYGIDFIEKKVGIVPGKGVSTMDLAIGAVLMGFRAEFFSQHLTINPENLKLDFYKNYHANPELQSAVRESEESLAKARSLGVLTHEKTLSLEDVLSKLTKNSIPIVLIDWNVIIHQRSKGYQGHFVPIVGYDKDNVYIHDVSYRNPQPRMSIPKELFDKARKSEGTDEDILIIIK